MWTHFAVVVTLAFFVCLIHFGQSSSLASDVSVLKAFFVGSVNWDSACASDWQSISEISVCQAYGVSCASNRVQALHLDSCRIDSTLPGSFFLLDQLVILSLYNNRLSGSIPTEWSSMQRLEILSLQQNELSGTLPDGFFSQPVLHSVHLSGNMLSGGLPGFSGNSTRLFQLYADNNRFNGTLPPSWSLLTGLNTLSLFNNSISGSLPLSWGALTSLQSLYLHSNKLFGTLPEEWARLAALRNLYLDNNLLSGTLPPSWSALSSMVVLHALHNNFSGSLPSSWSALSSVATLILSQNWLSGTLPASWGDYLFLTHVLLDGNRLTGTLPSSWGSLALLQVLAAAGNELSGSLPAEWSTMGSLEQLCLHENNLNGTLPPEWSNLTALVELTLYSNVLTGPLPESWGQLRHLQQLNLNNNKLNGTLPATWFASFDNMQYLYLSRNRLTGTLPNSSLLLNVKELSLDFNNFSGTLHEYWGTEWSSMTLLSAQGNMLTGTLPNTWISGQAFGGQIATLILSSNRLNGSVPEELCEMQSLQRLELAFNFFSGVLPSCWALQSLNDLETLRLNNNAFSGTLPDEWANSMQNLRTLQLHSNQLSGTLPESWGLLVCTQLRLLHLHFNNLSGTVPSSWADASQQPAPLTDLALYSNRLEGSLPAGWGFVLSNLKTLYLHDNVFEGTLPYEWVGMQQLQVLYLQGNRLDGMLPASWSGLLKLELFVLSYNNISGSLPPQWSQLAQLTTFNLSHNAVQGTFPTEWSQGFDALRVLDVSSNSISGPLPSTIGSTRLLEELHASDNDVTGPLPTTWGELNFLKVLRLSNNRRLKSSTLPSEWSLLTSLEQLWLNNCGLRGGLPETWLSLTRLQVLALNSNRLTGTVPVNLLNATAVVNVSSNCFHLPPRSVPQQQPQDACTASFSVVTSQSISFETSTTNSSSSSSSSSASRSVSASPSVSYSAEGTLHMMRTPTKTLKAVEAVLEDEVSEATRAAAGVAVVGAAAVAVAAAAGGIGEPSIGLLAMMPCAPESLGDAVNPMRYLVSPFVDFGPAAMALGNVGLFLAFFSLHMAVAFVVIRRGGFPDTDVAADVAARLRFPSVSFQAALWVTQGVVFGVVSTCSDELPKSVTVLAILALICSVPFVAALVGCAYWSTAFSRRHVSYTKTPEAEREASLFSSLVRWLFVPRGEYTPQSMTKRFGFAFASIHAPCLGMFPLAMVAHRIVFAVVSAVPAGSKCSIQFGVLGAISGIAVAWTCVLRPHRVRVDGLFSILSNAFTMLLSLVLILYEEGAIAAEDRDGCINGISVSQSLVSVLKLLYVVRNAMEQRAKQFNADNSNVRRSPPQHGRQPLSLWSVVCSVAAAPLPEMPPSHHASCDMNTGVSAPLLLELEGGEEMTCPSDVLPTVWIAPTGAAEQLDVDAPLFSVPESVPQSFYLLECSDALAAPGDGVQFWGADGTALKDAEAQPDCHLEWGLPLLDTTTTAAPLDASASLVPI